MSKIVVLGLLLGLWITPVAVGAQVVVVEPAPDYDGYGWLLAPGESFEGWMARQRRQDDAFQLRRSLRWWRYRQFEPQVEEPIEVPRFRLSE